MTDSKKEIIKIKGMHCKSCVEKIESKIKSLNGVKSIKINLAKDEAKIEFNPNKISLQDIKSEINKLGYTTEDREEKHQEKKRKTLLQGIFYGLIPHIGCIAFIIGSILGVTVLMQFFKPLLMNRYFFHILILISLLFATLSSILYLRKNGLLSLAGAKKKWKYLATMYGSTIGINLVLFMLIFPLFANVSISASATGAVVGIAGSNNYFSSLRLSVDIPCPGHAPLISNELKSIDGVIDIKFDFPNNFNIKYDSTKTSKQEILSLEVFKTYKATVLDESSVQQDNKVILPTGVSCGISGGCGCGCGG